MTISLFPGSFHVEKIHTAAAEALVRARSLYEKEQLMGSSEKDVHAEPVFKL